MKKMILSLMCATFVCTAFAQSCVSVQQVSTNYATGQITFDVKWGTCNNTNHLYRVWVFVDYRPVTITTKGAWSRADISATDKGTLVSANNGVWVTGTANATQRVTLTLNISSTKFDWCAFATDYPPNATMNSGTYTLKGTPPFILNGSTAWSAGTYTGSIASITDATGNPDGFVVHCAAPCGITFTVGNDNGTSSYKHCTSSTGGTLLIQAADNGSSCWCPGNLCPAGWRWPTKSELTCAFNAGGFDRRHYYWTTEENGNSAWVLDGYRPNSWNDQWAVKTIAHSVRCVRDE